jgi:GH35 family endo-1,4-beta-xylanase
MGMVLPDHYLSELKKASQLLVEAATRYGSAQEAADLAQQSIRASLAAIKSLVNDYAKQAIAIRCRQEGKLPTMVACNIGTRSLTEAESQGVVAAFNSAAVPIVWRKVEDNTGQFEWDELDAQMQWCRDNGLRICGGPLLHLAKGQIPDWLYLWEDDFEELQEYTVHFATEVAKRYQNTMHVWHCAAHLNSEGALALSEEQKMRLAFAVVEAVRHVDPKTPTILSFDQPWAEYMASEDLDLSPLHFADALIRAELGIAGIGLEINLGYWPGGTMTRDLLSISRQLDRWTVLGLPLLIFLTVPSNYTSGNGDKLEIWPQCDTTGDGQSIAAQKQIVEELLSLFLAKGQIHGIIWNRLSDSESNAFRHGGLFDEQHNAKPALRVLTELRNSHLL